MAEFSGKRIEAIEELPTDSNILNKVILVALDLVHVNVVRFDKWLFLTRWRFVVSSMGGKAQRNCHEAYEKRVVTHGDSQVAWAAMEFWNWNEYSMQEISTAATMEYD